MLKKSDFKKSRNRPEGHFQPEGTVQGAVQQTAAALGELLKMKPPMPSAPEDLCEKCPCCGKIQFKAEIEAKKRLCPDCGYHFRLSAPQRIALMCDKGSFEEWDGDLVSCDPLEFPGYASKLKRSRLGGENRREVLTGRAKIGGMACAVFAMEPEFMMGSMGSVVGEKITRLFERAMAEELPVVGFTVSGGARMQEGMLSLTQMAKTSGAVKRHGDAGLLYITVLTDPTTGGVTASFAMEGDILLAEPGALIAFAGPRVIEQTIRQKLPKNFQRAEYLLEHGFLDAVVERPRLKRALSYLLRLHGGAQQPRQSGEGKAEPKPAKAPKAAARRQEKEGGNGSL